MFCLLKGVTGNIVIDNKGERMAEFIMLDLNPDLYEFEGVISSVILNNTDITLQYNESYRPIYWHRHKAGVIPDRPTCGYKRDNCPEKSKIELTSNR
jgi:hypothetical protein